MNKIIDEDLQNIIGADLPWGKLSGSKIVVTGAGGFLGGYLVRSLLRLNQSGKLGRPIRVIAVVRNIDLAKQSLFDCLDVPDLEFFEWDLNQIAVPNISGCNYVIHAASLASPRFYSTNPVDTLLPNSVGTAALLQLLTNSSDPRGFLFVSSSEVYGKVPDNSVLQEGDYGVLDPATVRSCYAESKRLGETLCVSWSQQYKIPTFIVRPFHTYGPGLQPNDGRVFADFAFNIIRGENIVMNSDGTARRAFCYVTDAVIGFFTVLLKGVCGNPYNVANPEGELSVRELADLLVTLYPDKKLEVEMRSQQSNYLKSTFNRLIPDIANLSRIGWKPLVAPEMGFRRMIESYSSNE
ncbi:NAD-dependent epimerase/dehydratase family protein [Marinobacter confluentis]|uniref:NAD-dependent epimerase/dehydratase family protein n=1 Tax=Marinobacter confluentis TaxID=1697557 RepID=A0A4Z1BJH6_9GAMM|nr:NAD-dependent epimerase/dehydratase family protein [Marinobacter confluentis]TGN39967.1 NAD-dependent epimerase/dehydratase family protein [Marinobacter confluentis]